MNECTYLASYSKNTSAYYTVSIISFLVLSSSGNVITTKETETVLNLVRVVSASVLFYTLILMTIEGGIKTKFFRNALLFIIYIILTSMLIPVIKRPLVYDSWSLVISLIMITAFSIIISQRRAEVIPDNVGMYFLGYTYFILIVTILYGGLEVSPIPRFIFENNEEPGDEGPLYNLGTSNFYGFTSVLCAYLSTKNRTAWSRAFYVFSLINFYILCFIAGGRGEIIVTSIILLGLLAKEKIKIMSVLVAMVLLVFYLTPVGNDLSETVETIGRLSLILSGDLSLRDELIIKSITLLSESPHCIILGCGAGYFQYYFEYDSGLYPHNMFLEAVITFGVPVTVMVTVSVIRGLLRYYRNSRDVDIFLLLYIYTFGISMKSGSLLGSWVLIGISIYMISYSFHKPMNTFRSATVFNGNMKKPQSIK
jgi:hypothetical protein